MRISDLSSDVCSSDLVRSVALDVIPSELIESIEIKKSLTPDMDADTIGASIEINTTSAFDRKKPFVSVTAEGSYNDLTEKLSPKGSVDFATRLGEDFRSEEHTSELQSLMRISYAVFCLKKKKDTVNQESY